MIDINHKITTKRTGTTQAIIKVGSLATIQAIKDKAVPKVDVLQVAKITSLFAVKNTSNVILDCHPLPIEYTAIQYEIKGQEITIEITVKTIYKTGVEVEAMHSASIVALTMYDILKPINKKVELFTVTLLHKKGGKSDFNEAKSLNLSVAVVVCSDSVSKGQKQDSAGKAITLRLDKLSLTVADYGIIPDEVTDIQKNVKNSSEKKPDLVVLTRGTGLSNRDVTSEALIPLLDRRIPGIEDAIRSYGENRTP